METVMKYLISVLLVFIAPVATYAQLNPTPFSKGQVNTNDTPRKWANNIGVLDINANAGISGLPEYAWTNATASFAGQVGIARNGAIIAVYVANSTTKGDWKNIGMLNGPVQIGSQTGMNGFTGDDVGLIVWANGNVSLIGTNGTAQGSEQTALFQQPDPRQGTYINFNAPSGWNGVTQTPIMGAPVDFQVGLGGFLYGTNTLGGIAINRDALFTINVGVDMHWTTTENAAPFGCRTFLSYDNANAVWHWPVSRAGNGAYGNTGYQDVVMLDTKNKIWETTNATINFTTAQPINLGPSGSIQIVGLNNVLIGVGGTANTGNISGGKLSLNTSGTLLSSSILNRGNSKFQYLNFDSSGGTQLGKFADGSFANDVDFAMDNGHTGVHLNRPVYIQSGASAFTTPTSTLQVNGSFATAISTKTADYTLTSSDGTILLNAATKTATLPTAVGISGRIYRVKLIASATTGTVATTSSQTIDGSTTYSLSTQYKYVVVQSDGANWQIIGNN